jgi:hypothetical protein
MRRFVRMSCLVVLLAGVSGCAAGFEGEWLEEGTIARDGGLKPADGDRRAALRFEWPSTVRYGKFVNAAGVVEHEGLQHDTYFTMSNGKVAQFGPTIARLDGDRLTTFIGAEPNRRFFRVKHSPSIFPPAAVLPTLAKKTPGDNAPAAEPAPEVSEPVYASSSPAAERNPR